jgi:Domain of unknown function (DUF5664)
MIPPEEDFNNLGVSWAAVHGKNEKSSSAEYHASASGAVREALGIPYTRHIPLEAVAAAAASLEYGAKKYADRNWEKGLPWQQMIDSLKRHIEDFERGHDYDDGEDGSDLHQVCMIMASAMMLTASVIRGIGVDDRLPAVDQNALTAKQCAKWVQAQLENARPVKGK